LIQMVALVFAKDNEIYSTNAFYPEKPVVLSENKKVRGVDAVILGITPFQYNPVTEELIVYRDIELEIVFEGGNGHFGEDRLRSRWWDTMVKDMMLNYESIPDVKYPDTRAATRLIGCEYLIITPNDAIFQAWADTIKQFRMKQGILTEVVTLDEVGGNNVQTIENYINDAYENWDIPPAACLLLGDYGSDAGNRIMSPMYDNYCVSDQIYADVDFDHQAEIIFARITAQDGSQLANMVMKILKYERNPPTNSHYYNHPITAMGWQTERWFQICSETVNGFWEYELNKEPKRENAIYQGSPGGSWSSNQNTYMVVDYFGPSGLGYIPQTSAHLNDWGGNATRVNADINAGAFMMQHRDHGGTTGWGEPDYQSSDIDGLFNEDLLHVFSINCLTGKYNISGECFAEKFHRSQYGCLSITAASETSYSFVNDTYVWGMFDNMWTDFMPDYGTTPPSRDILPAFGNAAGKYFLEQSEWPYNTNNKEVTYYLFHHHGGAFSTVYSEMPEDITVVHDGFIIPELDYYTVSANQGAFICIHKDGEILGTATATGSTQNVQITPQEPGSSAQMTITLQNHYRFNTTLTPAGPPMPPQEPDPYDSEANVVPYTHLIWENGFGSFSEYYKIYLGTNNPPTNILNGVEVTESPFSLPEHLDHSSTYFWRVDAYNQFGSTAGEVWSFNTKYAPDENFETADFDYNMWTFGGDAYWEIDNENSFDGMYSVRSPILGDSESSSLFLSLDVNAGFNTVISFWKMVSTDYHDKLQFYMDGELKGEWGGLTSFSEEQFPVPTGYHTFEWRYEKDEANSFGDDRVWIDYIYFPPLFDPTVDAGEDASICEGDDYLCEAFVTNCMGVSWETSGTGTFDDNSLMCPVYTPSQEDYLNGDITLTLNGYTKEDDLISDDMALSFEMLPEAPATPVGPEYVDIYYTTETEYVTAGAASALTYEWMLTPEYAGTIEGDMMNASVFWNETFLGEAWISVKGFNDCGEGLFSDELSVTVDNTVGFGEAPADELFARILPNPNNGSFKLEVNIPAEDIIQVTILNSLSHVIFQESNIQITDKYITTINLNDQPEGVYLLYIEGKEETLIRKVIVQK